MIRALPADRSPRAIALGVVGAVFLAVGLGGCPGSLDASLLDAGIGRGGSSGGGSGGSGGGAAACNRDMAMAALTTYMCSQASCHSAAVKLSGFDMETAGWETHLVGVNPTSMSMACATNGPYLVAGSSPAKGLFLQKINGSQPCGTRMPYPGTTPMAQPDIDCVQSWANTLTAGGTTSTSDAGGGQ
jgi:hypothetical protein